MTATEIAAANPPAEITIEDFSRLVGSLSRLLTGLSALQPLKDHGLGLADWLVLTALAQEDGINNKTLARNMGVTGQRANQICMSLASESLIVVTQAAEDRRSNNIMITEAGRAKLGALNTQLKQLLADALEGKELSVKRASRLVKNLMSVVRASKVDKSGNAEKEGKPNKDSKRKAKNRTKQESSN